MTLNTLRKLCLKKIKTNAKNIQRLGYNTYVLSADNFLFDIDTHNQTISVRKMIFDHNNRATGNEKIHDFPLEDDKILYEACLLIVLDLIIEENRMQAKVAKKQDKSVLIDLIGQFS